MKKKPNIEDLSSCMYFWCAYFPVGFCFVCRQKKKSICLYHFDCLFVLFLYWSLKDERIKFWPCVTYVRSHEYLSLIYNKDNDSIWEIFTWFYFMEEFLWNICWDKHWKCHVSTWGLFLVKCQRVIDPFFLMHGLTTVRTKERMTSRAELTLRKKITQWIRTKIYWLLSELQRKKYVNGCSGTFSSFHNISWIKSLNWPLRYSQEPRKWYYLCEAVSSKIYRARGQAVSRIVSDRTRKRLSGQRS
jgi:hypothetical protein